MSGLSVPSFLRDMVDGIYKQGEVAEELRQCVVMTTLPSTEAEESYVLQRGNGEAGEVIRTARPRRSLRVHASDLESFAEAVLRKSEEWSGDPSVYLGASAAVAQWNETGHTARHQIVLDFAYAEEYVALCHVNRWLPQSEFHGVLCGDLSGCIDEALELQIATLGHLVEEDTKVDLQRTGLGQEIRKQGVSLVVNGEKTGNLPVSWEYAGPVFGCVDKDVHISLRLQVRYEKGKGLLFRLMPVGLASVLRDYHRAVAEDLRSLLGAEVPVVMGSLVG